jgi:NADPH-dependent 2,4-dienoyl-CoA reductase/sulfur reductase-like enzyme
MSNTSDATSIYIKVAQYFVNKKLEELKKKKFHLKDKHIDESLQSDSPQYSWDELLEWRKRLPLSRKPTHVAIIGAGVSGLRTAMLLQKCKIPYKVFEASHRPGGRIFTYSFRSDPDTSPEGKHDYYEVGAMRFPNNKANKPTFDLFEELGFRFRNEENPGGELIEYKSGIDDNIHHFNSEC